MITLLIDICLLIRADKYAVKLHLHDTVVTDGNKLIEEQNLCA